MRGFSSLDRPLIPSLASEMLPVRPKYFTRTISMAVSSWAWAISAKASVRICSSCASMNGSVGSSAADSPPPGTR